MPSVLMTSVGCIYCHETGTHGDEFTGYESYCNCAAGTALNRPDPDDALEAYVEAIDEICGCLHTQGYREAAAWLHANRDMWLLPLAKASSNEATALTAQGAYERYRTAMHAAWPNIEPKTFTTWEWLHPAEQQAWVSAITPGSNETQPNKEVEELNTKLRIGYEMAIRGEKAVIRDPFGKLPEIDIRPHLDVCDFKCKACNAPMSLSHEGARIMSDTIATLQQYLDETRAQCVVCGLVIPRPHCWECVIEGLHP